MITGKEFEITEGSVFVNSKNLKKVPAWYIITGGPSSGKTTILNELALRGFYVVPEAARVLIDRFKTKDVSTRELRKDEGEFQKKVLQMKLEIEEQTSKDRIVFFDRGIPDSIAYYEICNLDTKELKRISKSRYAKIFFLEQLPFKKDYARTEDEETVRRLNQKLRKTYVDLGYDVVDIPALPLEERVEKIITEIND